ncbi:alpha/beta hydrolase family protein [Clostridium beijerinckii]|uniref:Pimeloyl-ACP methyl ester carboxylesterase n=1 Tax=Clostridium beijerinckii TaxID=1520 RepID=A0AAX0AX32_CLOBE|nr:alpha/beta fold hydrolase [Clostridium beijerinckii]NRT87179.1 pimeloyl-ACP methyl ester carboxylesterase [Clostridium beijerinckii]NYC72611.1 dipeptidyl aminopeptidase/acylaminoacyl peptidase [Clostridium beijerinckii]
MKVIFKDNQFSFQILRLLGGATSGSADIGEVISTAQKIKEGDFESWCKEWTALAKRIENFAEECYSNGHLTSARQAYLRASNYYRTAEFYLHENPNDTRINELYNKGIHCFSYVMKLNNPVIEAVEIPYENTNLPGHFYHIDNNPRPTLVLVNGYDGTKEEFYGLAMSALERGMNFFTFEGPGQGEAVRKQHLFFRYDYENVISPVLDYLLSRNEIDPTAIVLMGESFGGYLAPRAAAFDKRVAACIANGGVYDFMGFRRPSDFSREEFFAYVRNNQEEVNAINYEEMKRNPDMRWAISHGMYVSDAKTPAEFILKTEKYYLKGIADKIKCPTLVIDTENEHFFPGQAKALYHELKCRKDFMLFTKDECAEEHCQVGAKLIAGERIFNWIEDTINNHINVGS